MANTPHPLRADLVRNRLVMNESALVAALQRLPQGAPVVAMIHGYRFQPGVAGLCPHGHILSLEPPAADRKAVSWPRHLGLDGAQGGLAIAFGWPAAGTPWGAYARAAVAGRALAELATTLRRIDPKRKLDVIAHSFGARVALSALSHAHPGDFGTLILLAGAETRRPTLRAMQTPAGQAVQVINVTSRENDLFDAALEWLVCMGTDTAIGQGLHRKPANWLDLQIDQPATLNALGALGFALPMAAARVCHWFPYLRPGTFALYRALLQSTLDQATLCRTMPVTPDQRWSRLRMRPIAPFSPSG
ncbi:MAG: alpha/beta hydrolase [Microgenomates group bacterium]